MAKSTKQTARYKRHKRIRQIITGTAMIPRVNIYKANRNIYVQLIDDTTQHTLTSASTQSLKLVGSNVTNAKKVGLELAKKAQELKITKVVFDRSGYRFHGKVKAIAAGIIEGGITI